MIKDLGLWLISIIFFVSIAVAADYVVGYQWFSFIEPKKENVRRKIFKNTRSYNESKIQDLIKFRLEYIRSEPDEKEALKMVIIQMFSEYDENKLPTELKMFLKKIKYGEIE